MNTGSAQPERFGDYYLVRPLGSGENTFVGLDLRRSWPGCVCVLKRAASGQQVSSLASLLTAGTSHPGLVGLIHATEVEGRGVLAMEYVHGLNLEEVSAAAARSEEAVLPVSFVPVSFALFVTQELCRALSYVHSSGKTQQLHGRLSPRRVLLSFAGQVKLSGIQYAGTPEAVRRMAEGRSAEPYEAPEIRDAARTLDERGDVFATGAVLWELLTGKRLPAASLETEQRVQALRSLKPPSFRRSGLPSGLDALVMAALNPDPAARPPSAAMFGQQLMKQAEAAEGGPMDGDTAAEWMGEQCAEQKAALDEELVRLRALAADCGVEGADDPERPGPAGWSPPEIDAARSPTELAAQPVSGEERAAGGDQEQKRDGRTDESADPSQQEDFVGVVLDNRYRIDRLVGVGGMGRVYEAEHVQIGKTVAVKVLHPVYSDEPEVVERFRREARAATAIGHPNIVDVTDSGITPDGRAFFVMEYLDGVELADVIIDQKWLDPHRAVNIAVQVCQALGAAHKAGIIHRDMKPENVFLTHKEGRPDFVKILDFGIAKSAKLESSRGGGLTQPGLAMGTPEYMSPEQAAGKPADPRVDVYATGGILYAMLVGRPPHQGANIMEILTKKATEPPVALREYRPEIPEDLERVVLSALASRPDERPQTMEELEYQLRKFLSGRGAAVAALLGLKRADDDLEGEEYYRADSPTSSAMAAIADTTDAEMEFDDGGPTPVDGKAEPVDIELDLETAGKPATAQPAPRPASQKPPPLPKEKRAPPPKPETLPPPDMGYLKSVTLPVVKRQEKSRGWVWLVVLLVVVGGVAGAAVFLKVQTTRKEKLSKVAAATLDGGITDGAGAAPAKPDAGVSVDASSQLVTAPPRLRLTKAQIKELVKRAWKAARKKRWTAPKRKSVWHYLGELENAAPEHPQIAKLRNHARKALMRKTALQYRRKAWKRVESSYRDLLALDPKDTKIKSRLVGVLVRRARQHLSKGINKKALVLAEEAVLLDGAAWSARYVFAQTLERAGKRKAAAAEYDRVLKSNAPRRIKASARKGLSRVRKKSK